MRFILFFILLSNVAIAQNFKFGKVSKEELTETEHPKDPDAEAAILYREQVSRFDYSSEDGFYLWTEVFERVKIYNSDGYKWATKAIPMYQGATVEESVSGLKGVTYNLENGSIEKVKLDKDGIFEEERSKYLKLKKFTMPDVKDGSVIEYEYKIKSPFISNIDEFRLQEAIPMNKAISKLYHPEYYGLRQYQRGWLPIDIQKTSGQRTLNLRYRASEGNSIVTKTVVEPITFEELCYTVDVNDVPALKENEAFSGNIDNYRSSLKFELSYQKFPNSPYKSYASTWEDVAKSIHEDEDFGRQLEIDRYFKDEIDLVVKDVSDPAKRIALIYEFVKNKMSWNGYRGIMAENGVVKAYKDGTGNTGDINLMLVAMLRYANFDANPVLISTKDNGIPLFPTRNGFNYVIASATIGDQIYLMDATNKFGEVNLLEEHLINWIGRLIKKDGNSIEVDLQPAKPATESVMLVVSKDSDKWMAAVRSQDEGLYALGMREGLSKMDDDERRQAIEDNYTGLEVLDLEFKGLKELYSPVNSQYKHEASLFMEEIGDKLYINPLFQYAETENPLKAEERFYPLDYSYPKMHRYIITINVPEGYQVESMPESFAMSLLDNLGNYSYRISQRGNAIQLMVQRAINVTFISPTYYQDIKKYYEMIVNKEDEKIVLSKI